MPTLSDRARDALTRRQKQAAGVTVTITRGAESITVTAVPGETAYTSQDAAQRTEISDLDYLVAVEDYVFGGQATTPRVGDRFSETVNGAERLSECQTPKNGEPAWRYSSQWRALYRIHCKKVKGAGP